MKYGLDITWGRGGIMKCRSGALLSATIVFALTLSACPVLADGWAVGENGWIIKSEDNGRNWSVLQDRPTRYDLNAVHFHDENNGIVVGDNYVTLRTDDAGETWTRYGGFFPDPADTIAEPVIPKYNDVYMVSATTAYAVGSGKFSKTTTGGASWSTLMSGQIELLAVHFPSEAVGCVVGKNGLVLMTNDWGENWTSVSPSGPSTTFNDVYFVNNVVGWIVGYEQIGADTREGRVFKTMDGGDTWVSQTILDTVLPKAVCANSSGALAWIVGSDHVTWNNDRICTTDNGGEDWVCRFYQNDAGEGANELLDVSFIDDLQGWVAGSSGTTGIVDRTVTGGGLDDDWWRYHPFEFPSQANCLRLNSVFFSSIQNIIVVDPGGSGDHLTIAAGIAAAEHGDLVSIENGVYLEHDLSFLGKRITVRSRSNKPDSCIVDCEGGRGFVATSGEDYSTVLEGVTITNAFEDAEGGAAVLIRGAELTIRNCVFENNSSTKNGGAIVAGSWQYFGVQAGANIESCVFRDNSAETGAAIHSNATYGSIIISYCTFHGNTAAIDASVTTVSGGAVGLEGGSSFWETVLNCTFANNTSGVRLYNPYGAKQQDMINNIIMGSTQGMAVSGDRIYGFRNNTVYGNAGGDYVSSIDSYEGEDCNISGDAEFCDMGGGVFGVQWSSPCLPMNNPCGGLIGAHGVHCAGGPAVVLQEDEILLQVAPGGTAEGSITIQNGGDADLTWSSGDISKKADRGELGDGEKDLGGPDQYGYRWKDSREGAGPVFEWIEISSLGDSIYFSGSGYSSSEIRSLPLPFLFPFYGNDWSTLIVTPNGMLTFPPNGNRNANSGIPGTNEQSDKIAGFWDGLSPSTGGAVYYYHDAANERFIVEYLEVPRAYGTGTYTFEIILYASGDIVFQYLDMLDVLDNATVGIESGDDRCGVEIAYNETYVEDGLAVEITRPVSWLQYSPRSGVVSPGSTQEIDLVVSAVDLAEGIYGRNLVLKTNAGFQPEVIVPIYMYIQSSGSPVYGDAPEAPHGLYGCWPNPFNASTTIAFDLREAHAVRLRVFDVAGRLVRALLDGEIAREGRSEVPWNGLDEDGQPVASGVYFYRLETGTYNETKGMALVK